MDRFWQAEPSPVSPSRRSAWAVWLSVVELAAGVLGWRSCVWVSSWVGLVLGYLEISLLPGSAGVGLVFESVVMGLGPGSSWADRNLAFTWANQTLGNTGVGLASGSTGPVYHWYGMAAWIFGSQPGDWDRGVWSGTRPGLEPGALGLSL